MSPSEGYFYSGGVAEYPHDVAKAKKLLADAGFTDRNRDSVVEDAAGHPVEFSLVTNSGNAVRGKIVEIIRNNLESIGFRVHYQVLDFDSLTRKLGNPPFDWDAALIGIAGGAEPNFAGNVWRSNGALHVWYPHQKTPATAWEAAIDSLFDLGSGEYDNGKRQIIYNEWQRIAAEQLPMIPTVLPERILCVTNKFGNLNPTLCGGLQHDMEYVFVK